MAWYLDGRGQGTLCMHATHRLSFAGRTDYLSNETPPVPSSPSTSRTLSRTADNDDAATRGVGRGDNVEEQQVEGDVERYHCRAQHLPQCRVSLSLACAHSLWLSLSLSCSLALALFRLGARSLTPLCHVGNLTPTLLTTDIDLVQSPCAPTSHKHTRTHFHKKQVHTCPHTHSHTHIHTHIHAHSAGRS
jgi:hypothetical protein